VGVDVEQMHVGKGVDEQPAPKIGGVAADLPALEVEGPRDIVVIESAVDEAAEHPEHQDVVGERRPLLPRSSPIWKSVLSRLRSRL